MRSNDIGGDNRTGKLFIFLSSWSCKLRPMSIIYNCACIGCLYKKASVVCSHVRETGIQAFAT